MMTNGTVTMTTNITDIDRPGATIIALFGLYYACIFVVGFCGNLLIIAAVWRFKHMKTVVNGFLMNLAIADMFFTLLSLFDALNFFFDEWRVGDVMCRVESTLIEVSYTVSVLTLVAVALERYVSICFPYRRKRAFQHSLYISGLIWIISLGFCSPLFYGYTAKPDVTNGGRITCTNNQWSDESRLIFYGTHSIVIYLLPLTAMCFSHYKISKVLVKQQRYRSSTLTAANQSQITISSDENQNKSITNSRRKSDVDVGKSSKRLQTAFRRYKIIKLLVVVTSIFFILWSPFVVTRLVKYSNVKVHDTIWTATKLVMFATVAVNCIIYALMSPAFKAAFKGLFTCISTEKKTFWMNASISKSMDITDTIKKNTAIDRAVAFDRNE